MSQEESVDMKSLLEEFKTWLHGSGDGRNHLARYEQARVEARENWHDIDSKARAKVDVCDLVLHKLLPYKACRHNQESGVWIHIAPAINRDIKSWFENIGWRDAEDWPQVGALIYQFVQKAITAPESITEVCRAFGASPYSRGIQSAFLSPILNALRPDQYLVINRKSIETLRYLKGVRYRRKISAFPIANDALKGLLAELEDSLPQCAPVQTRPGDILDAFCHWLIAIKRVSKKGKRVRLPRIVIDLGAGRMDPKAADLVVSRLYPDEKTRHECLEALAEAIESADRYGNMKWSLALFRRRVRLNAGRMLVMDLAESRLRIGLVPSMIDSAAMEILAREAGRPEPFATSPGSALFLMPTTTFFRLRPQLQPSLDEFMRIAARSAKRTPHRRSHSPGVLDYMEQVLGRKLPHPEYEVGGRSGSTTMPPAVAIRTPRTVFKRVEYDVNGLLSYIDKGDIGLPDIQRPFVWSATKVRDLFDSMYRGFPVGYLLFWENAEIKGTRAIGVGEKPHRVPGLLIVDGQQRLTSLYAVMRGKSVVDESYRHSKIEIAFRPRDGRFEVADAAVRLDPEFVPNITELWTSDRAIFSIVNAFLKRLEGKRVITEDDKEAIGHNLDRLFDLQKYTFTALEITPAVDEEAVADIFVRINSEGVKLNQADFILTLMSVFWDEGRTALEAFSRESQVAPTTCKSASPFNHLIAPSPDQLLRTTVALGFLRARLRSVYQVLRGKDVDTGAFSPERRDIQFARLTTAQAQVLDLGHWHLFLNGIAGSGFKTSTLISSQTALMYAYAFYLVGKLQCNMEEKPLQHLITRWFFMTTLTGRYTGSPETAMEADLNRVRDLISPEPYADTLEKIIATALTSDYWTISLPSDLETSSVRSPVWLTYVAAQLKLGTTALFSSKRLWEVIDPVLRPKRKTTEIHHLFPKAWLERNGYEDRKEVNQIGNLAYLEWPDNVKVGSAPPTEYVPNLKRGFGEASWERMCYEHALPLGWEKMSYGEFLPRRRQLMAQVTRRGFESLGGRSGDPEVHEHVWEGTGDEQSLWRQIESLELSLRRLVREKYRARWGDGVEGRMKTNLGDGAWAGIERNRVNYRSRYRSDEMGADLDALDFCYLGQLLQLMTVGDAWDMFRAPFRDRRELEDFVGAIMPVRNDSAHFRSVPRMETDRCRLAIQDLTSRIASI